jgi:hypothetical protein
MKEILYITPFILGGLAFYWDGKKDDYRLDEKVQLEYARLSNLMFKAIGVYFIGVFALFIFGII